jgi:hypothetical protein
MPASYALCSDLVVSLGSTALVGLRKFSLKESVQTKSTPPSFGTAHRPTSTAVTQIDNLMIDISGADEISAGGWVTLGAALGTPVTINFKKSGVAQTGSAIVREYSESSEDVTTDNEAEVSCQLEVTSYAPAA